MFLAYSLPKGLEDTLVNWKPNNSNKSFKIIWLKLIKKLSLIIPRLLLKEFFL
jgi:hypothetical protein